jgi:hypothetical protein
METSNKTPLRTMVLSEDAYICEGKGRRREGGSKIDGGEERGRVKENKEITNSDWVASVGVVAALTAHINGGGTGLISCQPHRL